MAQPIKWYTTQTVVPRHTHCYDLPWRGTVVLSWSHGQSWLDFLNYGDQRCSAVARRQHTVPESFDMQPSNDNLPFQFSLLASLAWWPPESELWTFCEALRWDNVVSLALFNVCYLSTVKLLDEWNTKTGSFEWIQKYLNLWTPQVDTIQNALLNKSIPIYVEILRNMDISSLALNLQTPQVDNNQNALLIKLIPIYVKILRNMDISFTISNSLWTNSSALRFVKIRPNSLRFTKIRPISSIELQTPQVDTIQNAFL